MGESISVKSNRLRIPVIVDDEEVAVIHVNPHSPLIMRDLANIMRAFNPDALKDIPDIPDTSEIEDNLEAIKTVSEPMGMVADYIDRLIAACDKLFGSGVTEVLLDNDDESLSQLKKVFDVITNMVLDVRKGMTDKYRA